MTCASLNAMPPMVCIYRLSLYFKLEKIKEEFNFFFHDVDKDLFSRMLMN